MSSKIVYSGKPSKGARFSCLFVGGPISLGGMSNVLSHVTHYVDKNRGTFFVRDATDVPVVLAYLKENGYPGARVVSKEPKFNRR
jgi:hypothetical protein